MTVTLTTTKQKYFAQNDLTSHLTSAENSNKVAQSNKNRQILRRRSRSCTLGEPRAFYTLKHVCVHFTCVSTLRRNERPSIKVAGKYVLWLAERWHSRTTPKCCYSRKCTYVRRGSLKRSIYAKENDSGNIYNCSDDALYSTCYIYV